MIRSSPGMSASQIHRIAVLEAAMHAIILFAPVSAAEVSGMRRRTEDWRGKRLHRHGVQERPLAPTHRGLGLAVGACLAGHAAEDHLPSEREFNSNR